MTTLDITKWIQTRDSLKTKIDEEIARRSKSKLLGIMPDEILMTQEQYDDLMKIADMPNMYHSDDRMYVTKHNVMEVRVSNRFKLTFQEAHALGDKDFDKWEKSVEGENG